ncbi:hypothetical protein [Streptomyces sp. NPDC049555]|uniref:preprotein translocase subunit SecY n=1 Tax=Streptomyces sp. NPDC049555 TaxID=3154930 RepID=UPI0034338F2D
MRHRLARKILLTLLVVVVFRLGQNLPLPGVDVRAVREYDLFPGPVRLLTGHALPRLAVLGLGPYPWFAAAGVMYALTAVVPRFAALSEAGPEGAAVLRRATRGLAVVTSAGLAVVVAFGVTRLPQVLRSSGALSLAVLVVTLTAGGLVTMWLAELVTERGIGDGYGVLLATQLLAVLPGEFRAVLASRGTAVLVALLLVVVALVAGIAFMEGGRRAIPVQYAKRMIGRRSHGGTSTVVELPVGPDRSVTAPAATLLFLVALVAGAWPDTGWLRALRTHMSAPAEPWRLSVLAALVVLFALFHAATRLDAEAVADRLRREGAFVPGIRPGRPTAEYLSYVNLRLTTVGALYLVAVTLAVTGISVLLGAEHKLPYGGEALFLVVGLAADTLATVDTERLLPRYEAYLR